jgi:hypothetical protein
MGVFQPLHARDEQRIIIDDAAKAVTNLQSGEKIYETSHRVWFNHECNFVFHAIVDMGS